jgi:hypothetical protein
LKKGSDGCQPEISAADRNATGLLHKFCERGLSAYSRQGNFASCGALRAARSSPEIPRYYWQSI